jgi:urease accessory protein
MTEPFLMTEPVLMSTLLIIADGRTPSGAHAHSGGVEMAVAADRIADIATLEEFLRGRLSTVGQVAAAVAAASCLVGQSADALVATRAWELLDAAFDARTPSAAQRRVSRTLGKSLQRLARQAFAGIADDGAVARPLLRQAEPHHPIALGALCAWAGGAPRDAAQVAAYQSVSGPASAAIRLLGLDPYAVTAVLVMIASQLDAVAAEAVTVAVHAEDFDDLPACSAAVLDEDAERHQFAEVRLFAS